MLALYLWIKNWLAAQEGQDLIEYAILVGLLIVASIAAIVTLGGNISTLWSKVASYVGSGIAAVPS